MKFTRTVLLAIAALIVAAGVWFFYSRADQGGSQAEVTVHIGTFSSAVDYAPFYVARANGYFDEELSSVGATAEYVTFEALAPLNDALAARRLDLVFEAEPPAFIAEAAGTDVSIPFLSVSLTQNIIARSAGPVRTLRDLSGRKVGVLTGTSSHYGLIQSLNAAGVPVSSVEIVNTPPAEGRAAFRSGAIDAWAVWPPFPETEAAEGTAREIPSSSATIHSLMVARAAFETEHPDVVEAMIRALRRAQAFIGENPGRAQEIVAQAVNLPPSVIANAWPKHNFQPEENSAFAEDLQAKADFLFENNFIDRAIDVRRDLLGSGAQ